MDASPQPFALGANRTSEHSARIASLIHVVLRSCAQTFQLWIVMGLVLMIGGERLVAQEQVFDRDGLTVDACSVEDATNDFSLPTRSLAVGDWWFEPVFLGYRNEAHRKVIDSDTTAYWWANASSFFESDLRLQFTGTESHFAVESKFLGAIDHDAGWFQCRLTSEFYLNQPFDRNVLVDYPLRESFSHNFDVDTFEISQLFVTFANSGNLDWKVDVGKFVTPFGRFHSPVFLNSRKDSPFIRSEAILFRETGLQLRYEPGQWRLAAAVTNGGKGRDANSSKALIARIGIDRGNIIAGASVKSQDGIGSEGQKEFNNHVGVDFAIRRGRFLLSTEFIYDEYGLRRPGFALDDIDWGRSIYNRQLNNGLNVPLSGWGWYSNLVWQGDCDSRVIQYGTFHPNAIVGRSGGANDFVHDQTTRRLTFKYLRSFSRRLDWVSSLTLENWVENAQDGRHRKGVFLMSGFRFNL